MEITIKSLKNLPKSYKRQVAEVFVEAYYHDLKAIIKDKERLIDGFEQLPYEAYILEVTDTNMGHLSSIKS